MYTDCNGFYLGQTGCKLATRLNKYGKSTIYNNNNTALTSHCQKRPFSESLEE